MCSHRRRLSGSLRARARADHAEGRRGSGGWQCQALLDRIRAEQRRRKISIQWVRGHSGHRLNEIADRLALGIRRASQSQVEKPQWDVIRCTIIADYEEAAGHKEAKAVA